MYKEVDLKFLIAINNPPMFEDLLKDIHINISEEDQLLKKTKEFKY